MTGKPLLKRNFAAARFIQVLISLILPFLFRYSLGPFSSTGAMMLWALIALVGTLFKVDSLPLVDLRVALTAGRGMGLDIVRQRIKKVDGELKINFAPGKFTEFTMKIPLDTSFA